VDIAGITVHPDERWMQQIARNVTMEGCGALRDCRYLLHDRDTKYTQSFRAQEGSNAVDLEHVLGEIQTDRGNLHVDGSSCDSSNNDHPTALRCRERAPSTTPQADTRGGGSVLAKDLNRSWATADPKRPARAFSDTPKRGFSCALGLWWLHCRARLRPARRARAIP